MRLALYLVFSLGIFVGYIYLMSLVIRLVLSIMGIDVPFTHVLGSVITLFIVVGGITQMAYLTLFLHHVEERRVVDKPPNFEVSYTVIVPAYNAAATICQVLDVITRKVDSNYVVVVNDSSTDATPLLVDKYKGKNVDHIQLPFHMGKAQAMVLASRETLTPVMVFIDADTLPVTGLDRLVRWFVHDDVVLVAGNVLPMNKHYNVWTRMQYIEYAHSNSIGRQIQGRSKWLLIASGALLAFRTRFLKPIVMFGDTLAEDFDLTLMSWKAGYRVVYDSQALAYTRVPVRLRDVYRQRVRWYFGGLQVLTKHRDMVAFRRGEKVGPALLAYLLLVEYVVPVTSALGILVFPFLILIQAVMGIPILPGGQLFPIITLLYFLLYPVPGIAMSSTIVGWRMMPYIALYYYLYVIILAFAKLDATVRYIRKERTKW